jgi:serine/threonine protein phosphatase PrpC
MRERGAMPDGAKLCVVGAMSTDVGRVREHNEDAAIFVAPAEGSSEEAAGVLALIADGMGGRAAGEVASALAAQIVWRAVYAAGADAPQALPKAFVDANRAIRDYGVANPEAHGLGATCTAILIRDARLWLVHVGDSRAYLRRDGVLQQLSQDHTLLAQLVRDGVITAAEAETSPGANYLLHALGARAEIAPNLCARKTDLREGDMVLLCSDGLHSFVRDEEIAAAIDVEDPQEACRKLVDLALKAGGRDNVTVGVFRLVDTNKALSLGWSPTARIVALGTASFPGDF